MPRTISQEFHGVISDGPLVAIGVATQPKSANETIRMFDTTWGGLAPQSSVAVRFLRTCNSQADQHWLTVCTNAEQEHPKTLEWFNYALRAFPRTSWICHADDDTWLNTKVNFPFIVP